MKFGELFKEYIKNGSFDIKMSTISTYKRLYNSQLKPFFDNMELADLNNTVVTNFIKQLLTKDLSRKYMKSISTLLYSIVNYARLNYRQYIELSYIQRLNVKVNKKKIQIFSHLEQQLLEKNIMNNLTTVNIAFLLMLYTGIRNGEMCALKVNDFDLKNRFVNISKTLQRIKNNDNTKLKTKIIIDTPKSDNSIRTIPLPQFIIPLLNDLFKNVDNDVYMLTLSKYKYIEPTLLERKFKKFTDSCNVKYRNIHVLRHTFANRLLELGIDIKTLSELLGHSDVSITLREYIHPDLNNKIEQIQKLNDNFLKRQIFVS